MHRTSKSRKRSIFAEKTEKAYKYLYSSLDDACKNRGDVALGLTAAPVDESESGEDFADAAGERGMRPEETCVRRAILVGVNDYARFSDLRFAGADVELMRSRLLELGFAPENIVALTTEAGRKELRFAPNKANIEAELRWILRESGPDDMIFVMFTGRGFQTDNYGGYSTYVGFAPEDAIPDSSTIVDFSTTVSLSKLFDDLKESKARFKWR